MAPERLGSDAEAPYLEAISHLAIRRSAGDFLYCPSSLSGRRAKAPGRHLSTHIAGYPEIICVLRGSMGMATPRGFLKLTPGQLLLIEPGVEHGEALFGEPDISFFIVHNTNLHLYLGRGQRSIAPMDLLGRTPLGYVTDIMQRELSRPYPDTARSLNAVLVHFSCLLHRRLTRGSYVLLPQTGGYLSANEHAWRIIEAVIGYCAAHLREPIRMEEIAFAAGYSQTHVSRLFAQHMGKTIAEHLRDLRMTYAQDLLAHSTLPVAEIGRTIGYTDQSNFGRAFKAAVGVSPRHYRHGERTAVSQEGAEALAD